MNEIHQRIKRGILFRSRNRDVIFTWLYIGLVRPLREERVQFLPAYCKKDAGKLKASKKEQEGRLVTPSPYSKSLKKLSIFSFSEKRLKGDLTMAYEYYKGRRFLTAEGSLTCKTKTPDPMNLDEARQIPHRNSAKSEKWEKSITWKTCIGI